MGVRQSSPSLRAVANAVGRVTDNSYAFPFTQTDIADTMGLSNVHVNRVLRELRELRLVALKQRILTILDVERLKAYCRFNPNYLCIVLPANFSVCFRLRWFLVLF